MINSTTNMTTQAAVIDALIQSTHANYVYMLCVWSSTGLLLYALLLRFGQEVEFIWLKSFSWPALLYIFTRYGTLFSQGTLIWLNVVTPSGSICTLVNTLDGVFAIFALIGVQGLLVARAYSFIGENRILSKVFVFVFLLGPILDLTENIIFDACSVSGDVTFIVLELLININNILTDALVFTICMWKIWCVWKLSRQAGIRSGSSLASILVKQSILRCCFVAVVTVALTIVAYLFPDGYIPDCVTLYQNTLSSIMVADFMLELRRQNSASIEASNVSLSSVRFSNVLENIRQSVLVEMSTPNPEVEGPNANAGDDIVDGNHGEIAGTVSDIQSA